MIGHVLLATVLYLVSAVLVMIAWIFSVVVLSDPAGFILALLVTGVFSFGIVRVARRSRQQP